MDYRNKKNNGCMERMLVIGGFTADELAEAEELMRDVQPTTSQEYTLKAIVHARIGQANNSVHYPLESSFLALYL